MANRETKAFRYGYDPADINPALRIEANERIQALQFKTLEERLHRSEQSVLRLERRLWLAVYGVAAVVLTPGAIDLISSAP